MVFRQSHVFIIFRLIMLEILLVILYLVVRIPKTFFLRDFLNASQYETLNITGVLYFIALSLSEMFIVFYIVMEWANETYEIREDSIIHRKGVFKLNEEIYSLRNLGSATIQQGLMGKLFNYGTITINSPILKKEFYLYNVQDPKKVVGLFEDNIENEAGKSTLILKKN